MRMPILPVGPSIAYVPLTQGQFAVVDAEDVHLVQDCTWHALYHPRTRSYYAKSSCCGRVLLHRLVMGESDSSVMVDHRSGVTLDCRKGNLRRATAAQNATNKRRRSDSKSGLKGVKRSNSRWIARIQVNGRESYLGTFDTPELAHAAYCDAAARFQGEFARAA